MTPSRSIFDLSRMRPPVRRVLAIDGGTRRLKLILAQAEFSRVRLLKQELIDLQAEGLVATNEIKTHLQATLDHLGRPPLALVLPQHLCISQTIDLPPVPDSEADKLIADEAIKLSGVSDSPIVYDFVRTQIPGRENRSFWVTLCQERDVREPVQRLGVEHEDVCEITTTANALIAAFQAASPSAARAILVHLGAQSTVVVVMLAGQGVFATSYQMGSDFFTRALARARQCSEETAESLKRQENLFAQPAQNKELLAAVDGWVNELQRQIKDWFDSHAEVDREGTPFELVASGGGFEQPGFLAYLHGKAGLEFRLWPEHPDPELGLEKGFETAFGTALQALGNTSQPVSLLPEEYRASWRKRLTRQVIEVASLVMVVACAAVLLFGSWQKLSLISTKEALLAKVQAAQDSFDANEALVEELVTAYEHLRPVLNRQQNTLDVLQTMALLEQSRSNRNLWYLLVADQESYFSYPAAILSTNRAPRTNITYLVLEPPPSAPVQPRFPLFSPPETSGSKPGLIVELCVPGDAEAARKTLKELVSYLKEQPLFIKADLLSEDLRRHLSDPRVTLPDRHYVLELDFAETDFSQPTRIRPRPSGTFPGSPKRPARPQPAPNGEAKTAYSFSQGGP